MAGSRKRSLGVSDEGLRMLVERYLDGVLLVVDGRIHYANRVLRDMTGYTADEALGMPASNFLAPEDRERVLSRIRDLQTGAAEYPSQYQLLRKDGRTVPVEISSRFIEYEGKPSLLSMIRNISRRREAEAKLQVQLAAMDTASEGIGILDDGERYIYMNPAHAVICGYDTPADLIGETWRVLYDDREITRIEQEIFPLLQRDGSWHGETPGQKRDGTLADVEISLTALPNGGLICVCRDVTQRRQAENERRRLEAQVQHGQKLESLGLMAGGIAHDFNNLLVGILGNAGLALSRLSERSPIRKNVLAVEKAADRAAELCKQLLAYSGKGRFEVRALDLTEVVRDMEELLDVAVAKNTTIRYDLDPNLPAIEGDAAQMRQIIMNLVTNASEAVGGEIGVIKVTTGTERVGEGYEAPVAGPLAPGRHVCLEVADSGCGMDDETSSRIFDPFFTTKFTGRGLGLAAVLGIVRGHGGAIELRTDPGHGTTFRALFPITDQVEEEGNATVKPRNVSRGSGTVLVIDDEDVVRSVAMQILENAGYDVLSAADGREGVECYRKNRDRIGVVLLDVTMPGLGGEESFRLLREIRSDVRVVLSSGFNEREIIGRFAGLEPGDFIQKPYRPDELVAAVRAVMDR